MNGSAAKAGSTKRLSARVDSSPDGVCSTLHSAGEATLTRSPVWDGTLRWHIHCHLIPNAEVEGTA